VLAARDDELPFVAVLLNNMLWSEVIAGVPFERRLLLLPQCLATPGGLPAPTVTDSACSACSAARARSAHWQAEADRLGYVTLVAEAQPWSASC
jgi:hypothetical protein